MVEVRPSTNHCAYPEALSLNSAGHQQLGLQLPDAPIDVVAAVFGVTQKGQATLHTGPHLATVVRMVPQRYRRLRRPLVDARGPWRFFQRRLIVPRKPEGADRLQQVGVRGIGERFPAWAGERAADGAGDALALLMGKSFYVLRGQAGEGCGGGHEVESLIN